MTNKSIGLDEDLYNYLTSVSLRDEPVLKELRDVTSTMPLSMMQIAPEQGQFMALLTRLIGAKQIIEVGTFTGYSALSMASALPADGKLIACDVDEETTAIASEFWQKAGIADRISLKLGPASETLQALIDDGQSGTFDMIFIDADKVSYQQYYDLGLTLLRSGGLILVDNVLWNGNVINPDKNDDDTVAIRTFNQTLYNDDRVDISMLPIADGLTIAMKK